MTIDLLASVADAMTNANASSGCIKTYVDLDRYQEVLARSRPDLIIEMGTYMGRSALWFTEHSDADVLTVDVIPQVDYQTWTAWGKRVRQIIGDSTSDSVANQVKDAASDYGRVMVVLDSDHNAAHVAEEIRLYAPLVSPNCYMVVEDGLLRWMPWVIAPGSPLDAIESFLGVEGDMSWLRDQDIEEMFDRTQNVSGWLRRLP